MITFSDNDSNITFANSTVEELGKKLVLINPERIKLVFDALVKFYPVKSENLPSLKTLPTKMTIVSKNETFDCYSVCSQNDFKTFIDKLHSSLDLITINDFLKRHPFNTFFFEL